MHDLEKLLSAIEDLNFNDTESNKKNPLKIHSVHGSMSSMALVKIGSIE